MVDKELIKKQYKEWVDEVSDDLEDKTYFTIDEIVEKVTELTLKQVKNNDLLHSVSDIIEPNYDEMNKRELIIYCEYLKLQRYPVKWKYVDGSK